MAEAIALSSAQHVFNQRLLSEHCLDQTEAEQLWNSITEDFDSDGLTFHDAMSSTNAQLQSQLGLELVALSIQTTRYYTIINKNPNDAVNKAILQNSVFPMTSGHPEQLQAFCKNLLQQLVDELTMTRADAINMRGEIISLPEAQTFVDRLVDEKWFVVATGTKYANNSTLRMGARVYAELSHMLINEFGMDEADMPQQIFL